MSDPSPRNVPAGSWPFGPATFTPVTGSTEIFRLYNTISGTHLYSEIAAQRDAVLGIVDGATGQRPWQLHTSFGHAFFSPASFVGATVATATAGVQAAFGQAPRVESPLA